MSGHVVTAAAVKVRVGDPGGNGVARIIKRGGILPDGVSEDQVKHLMARGLIDELAEEVEPEVEDVEPKAVEDMTVSELKAYAKEHDISLSGVKNKDEALAAIKAAAEAEASAGQGGSGQSDPTGDN